jgi:hypothetical protein
VFSLKGGLRLGIELSPDSRSEGKHAVLFRVKSGDGMKFVALPLGNANVRSWGKADIR